MYVFLMGAVCGDGCLRRTSANVAFTRPEVIIRLLGSPTSPGRCSDLVWESDETG